MGGRRQQLDVLTQRWRARREARRDAGGERPPADPERQARATAAFPYRTLSPAAYAEQHGAAMVGFVYDEFSYDDPQLDAWLQELGDLLRQRRGPGNG